MSNLPPILYAAIDIQCIMHLIYFKNAEFSSYVVKILYKIGGGGGGDRQGAGREKAEGS